MRVLVCGGRDFSSEALVFRTLDALEDRPTIVIHGACGAETDNFGRRAGEMKGADLFAHEWAIDNDVTVRPVPVDVHLDGPWPGAGPRRDQRMLATWCPDLVIAFSGGRGTADMVRRARAAGVRVVEVGP